MYVGKGLENLLAVQMHGGIGQLYSYGNACDLYATCVTGTKTRARLDKLIQTLYHDVNALLYSSVYDIKVLLGVKITPGWLKILSNHSGVGQNFNQPVVVFTQSSTV